MSYVRIDCLERKKKEKRKKRKLNLEKNGGMVIGGVYLLNEIPGTSGVKAINFIYGCMKRPMHHALLHHPSHLNVIEN